VLVLVPEEFLLLFFFFFELCCVVPVPDWSTLVPDVVLPEVLPDVLPDCADATLNAKNADSAKMIFFITT
jgi:hypothetical protein